MKLADLEKQASWPRKRDKMKYDADWQLYVEDLRRVIRGIPSIFE